MEIVKQLDELVKSQALIYLTDEELIKDVYDGEITMKEAEDNAYLMAVEDIREYLYSRYIQHK